MVKYGLIVCLIMSSPTFAGTPKNEKQKPAVVLQEKMSNKRQYELARKDKELQAASMLLKKHKGQNQAALEACWEEIEKIDDIRDDIQDQLQGRENNR